MTAQPDAPTAAIWTRLAQLFEQVVELPAAERGAFLDRECAGDADLRRRVEALLRADLESRSSGGITDAIGAELDALLQSAEPMTAGTRLGAYRVVDTLGRGGMGTVFLAERDDAQFRQRVAIKVVNGIALGPDAVGRFRSERQILAKLEHPYIAHLVDGGETDAGVPYLVMEYVEGEPIVDACQHQALGFEERLDLFLKICEAVQFAHQNLIVHRDLKPSNILVTSDGFPKLLDFGIAKILDPVQFEQTMIVTQDHQRLCTPDHAAPEQVLGRAVTTATDVYCLGILLYELLSGRRPYTVEGSRPGELERIICELPPLPPSNMVSRIVRETEDAAADSGTPLPSLPLPADRLRRRLRGDLDNIILKALRKEPERRYGSVAELAEDIRRHKRGLPVSARPDTWRYRTSKFVQRHAFGVATGFTLVALLAASAVMTTIQARRIERERVAAVQVSSFLVDLFSSSDPNKARGEEVKARDLLDEASLRIESELADQPEIQATLMNTMGKVYTNLGLWDSAEPLLTEALVRRKTQGDQPAALVQNQNDLGAVLIEQARYEEAAAVFREALAMVKRHLGPEHSEVARALTGLGTALMETRDYEAAEPLFREALTIDRRLHSANDPELARSITGLGTILWRRNDFDAAEQLFREALDLRRRLLGNDHPDTVEGVNNLAAVLIDRGDHAAAEPLFREALAMNERILGAEHPDIAINLNNLGYVLMTTGRFGEAEPVYRRAFAMDRRLLGAGHPDLAYTLNSLATTLTGLGRHAEAEVLYREALGVMAAQSGYEHRLTGQVLANYAALLTQMRRHAEAYAFAVEAKSKIDAEYPAGHWRRAFAASVLGGALAGLGRYDEARPLLEASVEPIASSMGRDSIFARDAEQRLAVLDELNR